MWMEKIRRGMLEVQTDSGLVYLRPSLGERVRLLWTFRNFQLLPQKVLNQRELTLVAALLQRGKFQPNGECRIGTVEWPLTSSEQSVAASVEQSSRAAANASAACSANQGNNIQSRSKRHRGKNRSQRAATSQPGATAALSS